MPCLGYDDVGTACDWLCDVFGFSERWRVGNHRAQLGFGNGAVVVAERAYGPSAGDVLVRVQDADAHHARAKAKGANITRPPRDFPYGERQYTVVDIGGHTWTFSQSIADLEPEAWGGVTAGPGALDR